MRQISAKTCILTFVIFVIPAVILFAADFPHGKEKHRTVACSTCHFVSMKNPDVTRVPSHPACVQCHDFAKEASKFDQFCGVCHSRLPEASQAFLNWFPPARKSEFGVAFSHKDHLKGLPTASRASFSTVILVSYHSEVIPWNPQQTLGCRNCHYPVGASNKNLRTDFTLRDAHENCFRCHGENPVKPPSLHQCSGCHKLGGPTRPNLFGMIPGFKHTDHVIDIRPKKKTELVNKAKIDLCVQCHTNAASSDSLAEVRLPQVDFCLQCHNGKLGLPDKLSEDVLQVLAQR
jgi:hypothetical protein